MGTAFNVQGAQAGAAGVEIVEQSSMPLPFLIARARKALDDSTTAAEVLESSDMASVAYDTAKKAARFAKARQAHDEVIAAIRRAQADAVMIEAQAKLRLANEFDAAQQRGDIARLGTNQSDLGLPEQKTRPATAKEIGLTHKQVHEARLIRDAELADPGIVQRTVEEDVAAGREPTKAKVSRVLKAVVERGNGKPKEEIASKKSSAPVPEETQHERDLRVLRAAWTACSGSVREEFLSGLPEIISVKQHLTTLEDELKELRTGSKCGVAEPPDRTPMEPATVNDGLDIPDFLRRW